MDGFDEIERLIPQREGGIRGDRPREWSFPSPAVARL